MIEHTVTFRLKPTVDRQTEEIFLNAALELSTIPGVQDFAVRQQVSPKNSHQYGITMNFDSQNEYDEYSAHPRHTEFIHSYWLKYVDDFQEADFQPLSMSSRSIS
ncbi:Stress responsive A/B Barrel Domain protein [Polystyrenella longa]|uniref:Stress responsive A/B Barrel Domain protein n=1 Tax=Polystyrenella longa TaxID=2528007 RepID=A0A518CMR8_9PLAN|nr:Dabb family protein [Polystyrenella longa]QDU80526.1 Stress responsive A/B Barrel Domain protein [Polystyrenella longa]